MKTKKRIVLLGATGSIGKNTLKVLRTHRDRLELVGIASRSRYRELIAIAREFEVPHMALYEETSFFKAREECGKKTHLYCGPEGLEEIACLPDVDMVVSAVVGTTGLKPTLAALNAGKDIALANKEILVLAGQFVMEAAQSNGKRLIPLDSEHNALFQCLEGNKAAEKLILTASGGPFRNYSIEEMREIQPEHALCHPNWEMGPKVTIDSSTMANKGLEVIEAHWLFQMPAEKIEVVIHPQSLIHSMVQFIDGSILAQMSPPSMTFPIQHGLLYPERTPAVEKGIDFKEGLHLDFYPPDEERFPCLKLAFQCLRAGGIAPAIFNAANEIAVQAFLKHKIPYLAIAAIIEQTLQKMSNFSPKTLEEVLDADREAQKQALLTYESRCF